MPYGRKSYRRSTRRPYRRAYRRPYRKKGPAVTLRRRVAVAPKRLVTRNFRMLKRLKASQYGSMQQAFHRMHNHVVPIARSPVLFDMLDFSIDHQNSAGANIQGGGFYQVNGGTLQRVSYWDRANLTSIYWAGANTDSVDTGKYLACWMDYCMAIEGSGGLDDTRVRVDIFTAKAGPLFAQTAGTPNLLLPTALDQLNNIAEPELNQLNSKYFKKVFTKVVYFNSRTDESSVVTQGATQFTPNKRYVRFRLAPRKLCKQVLTNPTVQGSPEESPIPDGIYGPLNVPINQPLWCLISTDDRSALTGDAVHFTCSRQVKFRDSVGKM